MVACCGASACDEPKHGEPAQPVDAPAPPPPQVEEAEKEKPWFEGVFRGSLDLAPRPTALVRDRAEREGAEVPAPERPQRALSLEVSVRAGPVSGSGKMGEEDVVVTGNFEEDTLRLVLEGERIHGTWVGEKTKDGHAFSGEVKVSRTDTTASGTSVHPYAGDLVLKKEK